MSATLDIDGELAVFTVHALKERLMAALDGAQPLDVDLSGVTEVDGAGLQLLVALRKEAARRGLALRFKGHTDAVVEALALTDLGTQLEDHGHQPPGALA